MSIPNITPSQLHQLYQHHDNGSSDSDSPLTLIDVRTPVEFQEIHALPAHNIPLDQLDPEKLRSQLGSIDQTIYLICRSGKRGAKACQKLQQAGFEDICNVDGGTLAWNSAGLPVYRGQSVISLERQVRIAVGTMVATGSGLTMFVSPLWGMLPLAAGFGLVFAGITGSCMMGMLLARMPWNQFEGSCENNFCASST